MKANCIEFLTLVLGLLIVASGHALTVSADSPPESVTTGVVRVTDGGSFDVRLCESANFGAVDVTSSTGASARDRTKICYYDDRTQREAFTVTLMTTDFELQDSEMDARIPANNLSIWRTSSPLRTSLNGCPLPAFESGIGLIYATGSPVDLVVRSSGGNNPSYTWPTNDLSGKVTVGRGEAGTGTAVGCATGFGDVQAVISLDLEIPPGQYPGRYQSTLTLEVNFTAP